MESDALLSIILVLTGETQLVPVDVVVIASVANEIIPSATGIFIDFGIHIVDNLLVTTKV